MPNNYTIKAEQAQALKDLEKLVGKKIPQIDKLTADRNPQNNQWGLDKYGHTFGVNIEGDNIIGLALHDCSLKKLPESIGKISSIEILSLRNNMLTGLPESFRNLTSLQMLSLWRNNLANFPEPITTLHSLQELWLQYNQLSNIPDSITNLKSLRYLNIGNNNFTSLPESITEISSLQKLMLWDNQLTALPEAICNLKALQILGLSNNNLKTLPDCFWRLKSLTNLDVNDNPWEGDWEGIKKDTTPRILEICRKRAPITIFVSFTPNDNENFSFQDIIQDLTNRKEIKDIYFKNAQYISESHLLLFIATQNSIINEQCQHEINLAISRDIPIIPIKIHDLKWEDLSKIELGSEFDISKKLGFELEFGEKVRKDFLDNLYEYIKKYKRQINLLEPQEGKLDKQWLNIKIIGEKLVGSEEFREMYIKSIDQFKKLDEELKSAQISKKEYILKTGKLLKY